MKSKLLLIGLFVGGTTMAQLPEDALRTAWFTQNGTARNVGIGGAMGSLGGEITSNHVNPAGIGVYKTREIVLSPGFNYNSNKFAYRGTDTSNSKGIFSYGTSGLVLGSKTRPNSRWTSSAFAVSVTQMASYNNRIQFTGSNNMSSFSEQYLEELVRDGADTLAALGNYIFGASLAFRTFLVDTLADANGNFIGYQSLAPISTGVIQRYDATTRGGSHEIALGVGGNMDDRLYLGASLTIPIVSYWRDLTYRESDATNDPNNQFAYFEFKERFSSKGVGAGLKLGMIYKIQDFWRIGFAFHTPQVMTFTDRINAEMTANTESYAGLRHESSAALNNGRDGRRQYNMITPWRAIASASYVFREARDTRQQRGFISADLEYVNYRGARFSTYDDIDYAMNDYYRMVNESIKASYKGNINLRIGGELKWNTVMFRLGGAYYGSPYADPSLAANRVVVSGGIGYRNRGMFIDLGYAHNMTKDMQFAYRLNDKPNTFATQSGYKGNMVLTLGFKL